MEVEIGKEALRFENGPFSYYGMPALIPPLPSGMSLHAICNSHSHDNGGQLSLAKMLQSWMFSFSNCHPASVCQPAGAAAEVAGRK